MDSELDHEGFRYYQEKLIEVESNSQSLTKTLWIFGFGIFIGRLVALPGVEISGFEIVITVTLLVGFFYLSQRNWAKGAERFRPDNYFENMSEYESAYKESIETNHTEDPVL